MLRVCLVVTILLALATIANAQTSAHSTSAAVSKGEIDALRADVDQLKAAGNELWVKLAGPAVAAISICCSALVTWCIFVWYAERKERRDRAIELLSEFMTSEHLIKARLIAQEYLMPSGSKYALSLDQDGSLLDFYQVSEKLAALEDEPGKSRADDRAARYFIRAIPSFFWLVDQARDKGRIEYDETLFNFHYAWYWTFIIRFRLRGCKDHRLFRCIPWLLTGSDRTSISDEYERYVNNLPIELRRAWIAASTEVEVRPPK